jgi:vacuolar protein sorting-associated protein 13A/C
MKSAHKPEGIKEGIIEGAKDFGKGVFDGLTGLVVQPVKGAQNGMLRVSKLLTDADGAVGFLKGVGRGVLGVSVKPISGVLDLTTRYTHVFWRLFILHQSLSRYF